MGLVLGRGLPAPSGEPPRSLLIEENRKVIPGTFAALADRVHPLTGDNGEPDTSRLGYPAPPKPRSRLTPGRAQARLRRSPACGLGRCGGHHQGDRDLLPAIDASALLRLSSQKLGGQGAGGPLVGVQGTCHRCLPNSVPHQRLRSRYRRTRRLPGQDSRWRRSLPSGRGTTCAGGACERRRVPVRSRPDPALRYHEDGATLGSPCRRYRGCDAEPRGTSRTSRRPPHGRMPFGDFRMHARSRRLLCAAASRAGLDRALSRGGVATIGHLRGLIRYSYNESASDTLTGATKTLSRHAAMKVKC